MLGNAECLSLVALKWFQVSLSRSRELRWILEEVKTNLLPRTAGLCRMGGGGFRKRNREADGNVSWEGFPICSEEWPSTETCVELTTFWNVQSKGPNFNYWNWEECWEHCLSIFRLIAYVPKPLFGQIIIKTDQNDDALLRSAQRSDKEEGKKERKENRGRERERGVVK